MDYRCCRFPTVFTYQIRNGISFFFIRNHDNNVFFKFKFLFYFVQETLDTYVPGIYGATMSAREPKIHTHTHIYTCGNPWRLWNSFLLKSRWQINALWNENRDFTRSIKKNVQSTNVRVTLHFSPTGNIRNMWIYIESVFDHN